MSLETEDILSEALEFLGGKPVIDNEKITYGPLSLSLPLKVVSGSLGDAYLFLKSQLNHNVILLKANTLLADHLFSPALFLAERIERGLVDVERKTVLELGAGAALPSLLMSTRTDGPSLVVATDYPDDAILRNMSANIERNRPHYNPSTIVKSVGYDWGTDPKVVLAQLPIEKQATGYDVLILSDLLHFFTSHDALVTSIAFCLSKQPTSRVFVGAGLYTKPHVCENFVSKAQAAGLVLEELPVEKGWGGTLPVSGLDREDLAVRKDACRYWVGRWKDAL